MKPNRSLVKLAQDQVALWQLIDEIGGELTEPIETWLKEIETNLTEKVDNYKEFLDEIEMQERKLRDQANDLLTSARSLANLQERTRDRIKDVMHMTGSSEVKGSTWRFVICSTQPALRLSDDLAQEYMIVSYKPDNTRIKQILIDGGKVKGASLEPSVALKTFVNKSGKK